ncbi:MAG: hypothetical protein ACLQG3_14490 [Terracidiphilus sp.]
MSQFRDADDQLILPFAEKEYVDVSRTAKIFGVSLQTVYRMAEMKDRGGRALLTLISYRRLARKRILYSSIVAFCDSLRAKYGIEDRRPKLDHPVLRHRDEDLLPFPLSDTVYSAEVLAALGYEHTRPLVCLIEVGRFDAYQIISESPWRISRRSLSQFLMRERDKVRTEGRLSISGRW